MVDSEPSSRGVKVRKFFQSTIVVSLVLIMSALLASGTDAAIRKVGLGVAYFNQADQTTGGYADLNQADVYQSEFGRYPAVWHVWSDWGGPNKDFPTSLMNQIYAKGHMIPLVTWEPLDPNNPSCANWSNDKILNTTTYNTYIKNWADAAKSFGHTVLVRFAHEMNGYWFVWGASNCGPSNSPTMYKQMWQKVVNIFRTEGATNVKFVWNPSASAKIMAYYPGNSYVDYAGITAFNWAGYLGLPWKTMVAAFNGSMKKFAAGRITKPVIAVEMGSAPDQSNCGSPPCTKSDWITTGYPAVYAKWPRIKAIVYFNVNMLPITHGDQPDWTLETPADAKPAYAAIAAMPKFQGTIPSP
jgi:beta-mannanase